MQLDASNTTVTMVPDEITSGTNTSGSSYKVTSSYANGGLVRGTPHLTSATYENGNGNGNGNGTTTTTASVSRTSTRTTSTPSTPSTPSTGGGSGY